MKISFSSYRLPGLLFLLTILAAGAAAEEAGTADLVLPQNLLGQEYVDIANGVSLRPPFGSEIDSRLDPAPNQTIFLPNLAGHFDEWEAVIIPTSKELVRFYHVSQRQYLLVSLLVTREKMDIEKLLLARQNFWQKYPNQITVEKTLTDSVNSRSVGWLTLTWQPEAADQEKQIIQEVLLQSEKKRFFLLSLIEPAGGAESLDSDQVMDLIVRNFSAMEESEVKRRWLQARKTAQNLLSKIEMNQVSKVLHDKTWYRILVDGQDKGFRYVSEQLAEESGKKKVAIQVVSYFEPGIAAPAFMQMRGWSVPVNDGSDVPLEIPTSPSRIEERYSLPENLASDEFDLRWSDLSNPDKMFRQNVIWKDDCLFITCFTSPEQTEPALTEAQDMKEKIFLPFSLSALLGRLMEREAGREYTFLYVAKQGICYYVQRIAAKEKMEVPLPPTAPPAPDGQDKKPTREILVYYMVSQMVPDGKIVETWLDEKGMMLRQRSCGIVIQQSDEETIKKIWPAQVEKITF